MKVELINPTELTTSDIFWLVLGCQGSLDQAQAVDQVAGAVRGDSGIYRISGEAEGVFVLSKHGKVMEITAMAGKGFLKHFSEIHTEIKAAAAACGAHAVAGYVTRKGLAALYKQKTKARFAEYFVEELLV